MGDRRPLTDTDRERVRELHSQGLSRNAIAREVGRNPSTVTKLAHEQGLSFDRGSDPAVRQAQEARASDARSRRQRLTLALLDDAEKLRQQLFAPHLAYNFGGKENSYAEHWLPEPGPRDKRDLMHAIGLAVDRAVRLDEYDSGASLDGVTSLLDQLGRGLAAKYGTVPTDTEDP